MNFGDPKQLPQSMIDAMSEGDRKRLGLTSTKEESDRRVIAQDKQEKKSEKVIQNEVEAYLVQLGYERRTPENIERGMPRSGWFIHLYEAKRNPILLDLVVLSNSTPRQYLELELKTLSGSVRDEQRVLIAQGASLARSTSEAMMIIRSWHEGLA